MQSALSLSQVLKRAGSSHLAGRCNLTWTAYLKGPQEILNGQTSTNEPKLFLSEPGGKVEFVLASGTTNNHDSNGNNDKGNDDALHTIKLDFHLVFKIQPPPDLWPAPSPTESGFSPSASSLSISEQTAQASKGRPSAKRTFCRFLCIEGAHAHVGGERQNLKKRRARSCPCEQVCRQSGSHADKGNYSWLLEFGNLPVRCDFCKAAI
eukprot:1150913-Pelagomonas_calceolata.AAC.9